MTCDQCGAEVPEQAAFCPKCGCPVGASGAAGNRGTAAARLQPGGSQGNSRDVPEDELWSGAYSPKAMVRWFIRAGWLILVAIVVAAYAGAGSTAWMAIAIGAVVIFGWLCLSLLWKRWCVQYQLTTHRLVLRKGILSKTDDRILLVDIDDITVHQGLIERMLNVGTITLITSDQTTKNQSKSKEPNAEGTLTMDGIENPRHVGDLIDESRRAERTRRGVYMMNA